MLSREINAQVIAPKKSKHEGEKVNWGTTEDRKDLTESSFSKRYDDRPTSERKNKRKRTKKIYTPGAKMFRKCR